MIQNGRGETVERLGQRGVEGVVELSDTTGTVVRRKVPVAGDLDALHAFGHCVRCLWRPVQIADQAGTGGHDQ